LDNLRQMTFLTREALEAQIGCPLEPAPLLVTYHPVTLEHEQVERQIDELLAALAAAKQPIIFTLPNADTHARVIIRKLRAFVAGHPKAYLVANLGTRAYFSLMAYAAVMVGNSSSGLIEAPSLGLPVVNIGTRQQGRLRAANVIDVGDSREEILRGMTEAAAPAFKERLRGLRNPYGEGRAADLIVRHLKDIPLDERLIRKRFMDVPAGAPVPREPQEALHAA
jgi:UDP-hydrolysing UDP-N-acetyl-D-glucosamine 2-epimerase